MATILLRRGTAAAWTTANSILHQGEIGLETDTGKIKIGDGLTAWTSLGYWVGSAFANPMTTQDDIIVGGISGAPGRLGKGTDGQVLTVDPTTHHLLWATPAGGGTPAVALGTAAAAGSAGTFLRDDDTIAAFDTTVPVSQAFGDAAATGAIAFAARRDHVHGMPTSPLGLPLALTGATAATRYVGGTASGAPTAGTFAVGDFIIDQTGKVYICTVAGTPGTWILAGGGSGGSPLTTKGDLYGYSTANARVPVGADGTLLVADSTQALGLRYDPRFHGAKVYNSTTESIVTATWTTITFDSEEADTDAFHDTTTNTSRLTIPTGLAGTYLFTAGITFASNTTGGRWLRLLKNGTTVQRTAENVSPTAGGNLTAMAGVWVVPGLVAADYLELQCFQDSGGALAVGSTTADYQVSFGCHFLG